MRAIAYDSTKEIPMMLTVQECVDMSELELAVQAGEQEKINDRNRVLESFIATYCK